MIFYVVIIFTLQCGNYGVGGDYWAHMDRSKGGTDGPYRGPNGTGDRLATIVNILQAPKAGM